MRWAWLVQKPVVTEAGEEPALPADRRVGQRQLVSRAAGLRLGLGGELPGAGLRPAGWPRRGIGRRLGPCRRWPAGAVRPDRRTPPASGRCPALAGQEPAGVPLGEPAIRLQHGDGRPALRLQFDRHRLRQHRVRSPFAPGPNSTYRVVRERDVLLPRGRPRGAVRVVRPLEELDDRPPRAGRQRRPPAGSVRTSGQSYFLSAGGSCRLTTNRYGRGLAAVRCISTIRSSNAAACLAKLLGDRRCRAGRYGRGRPPVRPRAGRRSGTSAGWPGRSTGRPAARGRRWSRRCSPPRPVGPR